MAADDLTRIEAKLAAEVAGRSQPGEPARALLRPEMTPGGYLDALIAGEAFQDATKFLAHALPKREAVWWACRSARKAQAGSKVPAAEPSKAEAEARAIAAAEAWAADSSEANRRAAGSEAEAAGYGSAGGCAAAAAFWSGGSLAPPGLPAVPPADHLTAHGVSGSILFSVIALGPEDAPESFRALLSEGLDVARGKSRWPEAPAPPPPSPARPAPAPSRSLTTASPSKTPDARRNLNWD